MKIFGRLPVKRAIAVLTLIFTILPSALVSVYMYNYTASVVKGKYMYNYVNSMFSGIEENFSTIFKRSTMTLLNIITYNPIYSVAIDKKLTHEEKQLMLAENIDEILVSENLVAAVDIVLHNGETFRFNTNGIMGLAMPEGDFYANAKLNNISVYPKPLYDLSGTDYLCVAIKYSNYVNQADLGYIAAYIPKDKIRGAYDSYHHDNSTIFVTVDGNVLMHPDEKYAGTVFYYPGELVGGNSDYLYKTYKLKNLGTDNEIQLHMIAENDSFYAIAEKLNFYILLLLCISALSSMMFSILISRSLTKGIKALIHNMKEFSENRVAFEAVEETNELFALEMHFNKMAKEIQKLIAENNRENEQKRIAELSALQSQINPHFIYNAIDSIKWMAKLHKPYEDIEKTVYALAQFFRISLHKGETYIKISEEIEHVRCYLAIEKMRFRDLFEVDFAIESEIEDFETMKIILQPIVENSIKHGFKNIKYKGIIKITGYFENDFIVFKITDNGCGFEMSGKGALPESESEHGGYGLRNINERIAIAYGGECGVTVSSEKGKGTAVTVKIKKTKDGEKND